MPGIFFWIYSVTKIDTKFFTTTLRRLKEHIAPYTTYSLIIKVTTLNSNFLMVYSSNNILFLTCILHDYMAHEITKEFWKNIHFKNMMVSFLQRHQNPLRWNTPEIIHFLAWQKLIFAYIAPWYLFLSLTVVSIVFRLYFGHFLVHSMT